MDKPRLVCVVAQVDPTGASGLGRAAAVVVRAGMQVAPVATGVAVQTDRRVRAILPVEPRTLRAQLDAVWAQRPPDAIYVGALPSARIGRTLRACFRRRTPLPPVVIDPALAATSGGALAIDDVRAEVLRLCPLLALLTPNAHEAAALTGLPVHDERGARAAGQALVAAGAAAVLVKGGHLPGGVARDTLVMRTSTRTFSTARVRATVRGTGCALAAAAAAHLAAGEPVERAVVLARALVRRELRAAATSAGTRGGRGKR